MFQAEPFTNFLHLEYYLGFENKINFQYHNLASLMPFLILLVIIEIIKSYAKTISGLLLTILQYYLQLGSKLRSCDIM